MKTLEELRKLDTNSLLEELKGLKEGLFKVKFEVRGGQSKNGHLVGKNKKQIARVKTLLNELDHNKPSNEV
jgi:ribosomal protein L29